MENVVVLTFREAAPARESLIALQGLHHAGDIGLEAVAVVERTQDGTTIVLEQIEDSQLRGTATGGVIGGILGLLTGPFGLILGGATGALVGSLIDVADVESSDQILRAAAPGVPPGRTATIAVVEEKTPAALDEIASRLDGTLRREPRGDVELEIAEAEAAAIAAKWDAEGKRTVGDRIRDVKDSLSEKR